MLDMVIDTSTLIAFTHLGLLEALCDIYEQIFIPKGVLEEFGEISLECAEILEVEDKPLINLLRKNLNLGKGEAEVIALSYTKKYRCAIDAQKARKVAKDFGLAVTGTIGILARMKDKNIITSVHE